MKVIKNDPNGWMVYVARVRELLGDAFDESSHRHIMTTGYIRSLSPEAYVQRLRKKATAEWRSWVKDEHGGWRKWAIAKVSNNPRIRKRLPRITAKAKLLAGVTSDELVKW
jgi:hypothetical protein